jgi:hypothetical protein
MLIRSPAPDVHMTESSKVEPVKGVRMWIDQQTIHLKAVDEPYSDPVELAEHEAEAVIRALQSLLDRLRKHSAR